ncbi:sialic acid-binding Ig-like lectin 7 [Limanda limanda]|uniref:sialic acid-binding Ig-like lectin 7 n=1 Tax=Limanda limanda TaxID=27771 RepID=UPI0029C6EE48|nr:sialic acid-binding Ig-like lectin 7 [Limanda limanda]
MIFNSDTSSDQVQSEFKGRVSLLESDVKQKNCSIIINDLKEWDSGTYQLRVITLPRAGSSVWGKRSCPLRGYCNTLVEGEISAEAGLCVVIPCSFTVPDRIQISHIVWFKCESTKWRCDHGDMIFNSDTSSDQVQSEFKGRVSLLESDVNQKNCSIIINDLKESDSGEYQLRVIGLQMEDALTFSQKATVAVKGLSQRPTVMIPTLTEGQQTTLTCTAPGLCSGSEPTFTWRWRRRGESDTDLTGNITAVKTENVASFAKRSSSTLSFSPSAEHHGTNITCTVLFQGNVSTEETATLNVTYVKEVRITQNASVSEGETLNLTCKVDSFPPSLITWTKVSDHSSRNGTGTTLQNNTFSDSAQLREERGTATLSLFNVTAGDAGQYVCTVTHMNSTWKENVNVTVIYMRDPVITGNLRVKEGAVLNLTCRDNSFPPSHVAWTQVFDQSSRNGAGTTLQKNTFTTGDYLENLRFLVVALLLLMIISVIVVNLRYWRKSVQQGPTNTKSPSGFSNEPESLQDYDDVSNATARAPTSPNLLDDHTSEGEVEMNFPQVRFTATPRRQTTNRDSSSSHQDES